MLRSWLAGSDDSEAAAGIPGPADWRRPPTSDGAPNRGASRERRQAKPAGAGPAPDDGRGSRPTAAKAGTKKQGRPAGLLAGRARLGIDANLSLNGGAWFTLRKATLAEAYESAGRLGQVSSRAP